MLVGSGAGFVDHTIDQRSDAADLNLDRHAGFKEQLRLAIPSNATGRSGDNDISRLQRQDRRCIGDDLRDADGEVRDWRVLFDVSIHPRGEGLCGDVADFV